MANKKGNESENKSPVALIVIFILLAGFIFGLPYISDFVNEFRGPIIQDINGSNGDGPRENQNEIESKTDVLNLSDASFNFNQLMFSDFNLLHNDDYKINFKIGSNRNANFVGRKFFLEFYDNNGTFLERAKISSNVTITANTTTELELRISESTHRRASRVGIVLKNATEYPQVNLAEVDDIGTLTCTDKGNRITYFFTDSKLFKIEELNNFTRGADAEAYVSLLTSKRGEIANLNNQDGISASLVESNDGFTTNILLDLDNVRSLNNPHHFKKDTSVNVVSFEMNAMRFNCN